MPVDLNILNTAGQEAESKQNSLFNLVNQGAAMIFGSKQKRKDAETQQNYNKELMAIQNQYNIESVERQKQAELEMFEKTGYAAKTRQMKEAGLNPALIYGMGAGGGGGVTGNISAPTVSGQSAPDMMRGTANQIAQQGMMLQLSKMASEIEVNKSVAAVNNATAGLRGSETKSEGLKQIGLNLDNELNKINLNIEGKTIEDKITAIKAAADKAVYEAQGAVGQMTSNLAKGTVDMNTIEEHIKLVNQAIAQSYVEIASLKEGIKLSEEKRKEIANQIEQNWINLENNSEKMRAETQKLLKEAFNNDLSKSEEFINELINKLLPNATIIPGLNKLGK